MKSLKSQPPPCDSNPMFPFLPERAATAISAYIDDVAKDDSYIKQHFPQGQYNFMYSS